MLFRICNEVTFVVRAEGKRGVQVMRDMGLVFPSDRSNRAICPGGAFAASMDLVPAGPEFFKETAVGAFCGSASIAYPTVGICFGEVESDFLGVRMFHRDLHHINRTAYGVKAASAMSLIGNSPVVLDVGGNGCGQAGLCQTLIYAKIGRAHV
mgnify:CR=1 FL=1